MGYDSVIEKGLDLLAILFKRRSSASALKDAARIGQIARDLVRDNRQMGIDCFFLVMVHNCNKEIIPHGFKFRSIIGGDFIDSAMPGFKMESYKDVYFGFEFAELLRKVCEYKQIDVSTADITDRQLKINYEFEKIRHTRFFFLKKTRKAMWYCVAGTTYPGEKFLSNEHAHRFNMAANEIRNIMRRY